MSSCCLAPPICTKIPGYLHQNRYLGTDHELLYGEEGEILLAGPTVMKEHPPSRGSRANPTKTCRRPDLVYWIFLINQVQLYTVIQTFSWFCTCKEHSSMANVLSSTTSRSIQYPCTNRNRIASFQLGWFHRIDSRLCSIKYSRQSFGWCTFFNFDQLWIITTENLFALID